MSGRVVNNNIVNHGKQRYQINGVKRFTDRKIQKHTKAKKQAILRKNTQRAITASIAQTVVNDDNIFRIYTDGSCFDNGSENGNAGYGVFFAPNDSRNVSAPVLGSIQTNNRGELLAIAHAIKLCTTVPKLIAKERVYIMSDSMYSINCVSDWCYGWERNGWCKKDKASIMNCDIIQFIYEIMGPRDSLVRKRIRLMYIKAHAKHYGNTEVDVLAKQGAKKHPVGFEKEDCLAALRAL